MSWEREHHHMNMPEGEHYISLVDKSVVDRHGNPARWALHIHMGDGEFEYKIGDNKVRIKLGGNFTVQEDGSLQDDKGNVFDPRAFERELIEKLNGHHERLKAYAARHKVPHLQPGGKTGSR